MVMMVTRERGKEREAPTHMTKFLNFPTVVTLLFLDLYDVK